MGLLERVRAERAWPVGKAEEARWEQSWWHQDNYSPPEYGDYLATSNDIYSVANFRARHIGGLDLRVFRGRDSEKEEITSGPVPDILRRVNPHWTFKRLMRMTELSMCLWGEAFWAVEKPPGGQPKQLWWMKSDRVKVVPDPQNYIKGYLYEGSTGELIPFAPSEVIWFRYPNPLDEMAGLSPVAAARLAADTSSAMMKSNRNLFSNGMQMGGLVTPAKDRTTFSPEQADDLEKKLEQRFKGVDKAHKWGVLRFDAQVQQMSVTPEDAQFIAGLNMTFRQVCRAYGVPSPLLYDLEHATLANLRELQLTLWQDTLVPDAQFYAADIEEQLLPMFRRGRGAPRQPDHVAWDFSGVPSLQESSKAVWDRERQQIEVGALLINEWRKDKGLPPVPWGDVAWLQGAKVPVSGPQDPTNAGTNPDEGSQQQSAVEPTAAGEQTRIDDLLGAFDESVLVQPSTNGHH